MEKESATFLSKRLNITKPLLRVDEAAECLNVSKYTVYRLINNEEIQATKVGSSLRVFSDSLERYIHKNIINPQE